jgi:hypothetical protein
MPIVSKALITAIICTPKTAAMKLSCYMHVPRVKFQGHCRTLRLDSKSEVDGCSVLMRMVLFSNTAVVMHCCKQCARLYQHRLQGGSNLRKTSPTIIQNPRLWSTAHNRHMCAENL